MKAYTVVPLLVAAAVAQVNNDYGPNCGIVNRPVSALNGSDLQVIGQALNDINATAAALNDTINAFKASNTGTTILNLEIAAQNVIAQLVKANNSVAAVTPLQNTDDDAGRAYDLTVYVASLACNVNRTVDNFINIKQAIVDACLGQIAIQQLTTINNDGIAFNATTYSKLPELILPDAIQAVSPIIVALASGVSAYADATSLPASCVSSSSTTGGASATTSGGSSATTSAGGNGGSYPTTSAGGNGGSYPTTSAGGNGGSYPTTSDDCEDDTTTKGGSYPTGGSNPTGGSYPTGGSHTTTYDDCEDDTTTHGGSYPTGGSNPTGGSYPTGGSHTTTEDDCEDDYPTTAPGGVYTTGGSKPTGGYTVTSYYDDCVDDNPTTAPGGVYTTGGSKPTGGASSYTTKGSSGGAYSPPAVATATTAKNPISTYKGAAPTNAANGFGMVAAVAAAALLL